MDSVTPVLLFIVTLLITVVLIVWISGYYFNTIKNNISNGLTNFGLSKIAVYEQNYVDASVCFTPI